MKVTVKDAGIVHEPATGYHARNSGENEVTVELPNDRKRAITPGQAAVFMMGDVCRRGGWII